MDNKTIRINTLRIIFSIVCFSILTNCTEKKSQTQLLENPLVTEIPNARRVDDIRKELLNSQGKQVLVVAHRGDWRHAPENSIQAIKNCIDMGVDMVEIDVRMTKDSVLVLMHDKSIDRTTTGKGEIKDLSWEYLQTLQLRDGIWHETPHKIPTLEEALLVAKGKILINLDKSYPIFSQCYDVAKRTGTLDQIVIKGAKTIEQVEIEFGQYLDKVLFMPIVRLAEPKANSIVDGYLKKRMPVAFEFTAPYDTLEFIDRFAELRQYGSSVWVNSLWSHHNGGHDDEKAALDISVYDWYLENEINIIQTDRPKLLLQYLRSKDLHK